MYVSTLSAHVCATCMPGTLKGPEGSIRFMASRSERRLLAAVWVLESTPRPKSSSALSPGPPPHPAPSLFYLTGFSGEGVQSLTVYS